jgi:histidine ammonia-lyase
VVPFYDKDRYFAPDIRKATEIIQNGGFNDLLAPDLLPSFANGKRL